jgi:hypothetical protein
MACALYRPRPSLPGLCLPECQEVERDRAALLYLHRGWHALTPWSGPPAIPAPPLTLIWAYLGTAGTDRYLASRPAKTHCGGRKLPRELRQNPLGDRATARAASDQQRRFGCSVAGWWGSSTAGATSAVYTGEDTWPSAVTAARWVTRLLPPRSRQWSRLDRFGPIGLGWVDGRGIIHHHGPGAFAKPMSLPGEWLCTKDLFLPTNSSCAKSWVVL